MSTTTRARRSIAARRPRRPPTNAAVGATAGTVLLSGSSVANALYHSADGGWTENNENVFVGVTGAIVAGPVPYLRGSSDRAPDGSSYDKASPYATWHTATYTRGRAERDLGRRIADERGHADCARPLATAACRAA